MVGEGTRLRGFLLAAFLLATAVRAPAQPVWTVDGGCRDGQPHGRYELRDHGKLRAVGAFNHGKRTGSFIFWTARGSRVAHIPYDDDLRNGTLATWYETRITGAEPARRFESMWRRGAREGLTRTWYAGGRRRSETEYERGRPVTTAGWTDTGTRLNEPAAREVAERDAIAADAYYMELETLVRDHLPHCD